MAFVLVTVRKEANMWHVHVSDKSGSIEKIVSQVGAVSWVKNVYAFHDHRPIELLVYDERGELLEAWARTTGSWRDLKLIIPKKEMGMRY